MLMKNFSRTFFGAVKSSLGSEVRTMESVKKLEARAVQAENLIESLKEEVARLEKIFKQSICSASDLNEKKYEELKNENQLLRNEINEWKVKLMATEKKLNELQVNVGVSLLQTSELGKKFESMEMNKDGESNIEEANNKREDKENHIGKWDLRVGKVISVMKHPNADTLYVQNIDVGEESCRVVVSGLVNHLEIEDLKNRMVIVLCNIKPAKMKGIRSEGMVLCANTPERVELLIPPINSEPGDPVIVKGYNLQPADEFSIKKKTYECVANHLKTDDCKIATYKQIPLCIKGKGYITAASLANAIIK